MVAPATGIHSSLVDLLVTAQVTKVLFEPGTQPHGGDGNVSIEWQVTFTGRQQQPPNIVVPVSETVVHPLKFAFIHHKGLETLSDFVADDKPVQWQKSPSKGPDAVPALPREVVVELGGLSREIRVALAPGGRLLLKRSVSTANPYVASVGHVGRSLTPTGERTETAAPTGKYGAAQEIRVLEFQAAPEAREPARVVIQLRRPWESAASIQYTVIVDFAAAQTGRDRP